jgi:CRISPR/Cas system CSM-associated protein Csm3 (group 7 of RAMP superfamily)
MLVSVKHGLGEQPGTEVSRAQLNEKLCELDETDNKINRVTAKQHLSRIDLIIPNGWFRRRTSISPPS